MPNTTPREDTAYVGFKHEPNIKGKVKGRPCSLSPTGSRHQNSRGDGNFGEDRGAKDTTTFAGKIPSEKSTNLLVKVRQGKLTDNVV